MATDLLTAPQVAALLSVSGESVRRWAEAGRLPSITLPSGQRRFRMSDIDAILAGAQPEDGAA